MTVLLFIIGYNIPKDAGKGKYSKNVNRGAPGGGLVQWRFLELFHGGLFERKLRTCDIFARFSAKNRTKVRFLLSLLQNPVGFAQALAVFALQAAKLHFLAVAVAKLKFCNSLKIVLFLQPGYAPFFIWRNFSQKYATFSRYSISVK
jgi:hypothetical protein